MSYPKTIYNFIINRHPSDICKPNANPPCNQIKRQLFNKLP